MTQAFLDYYRCPDSAVDFRLATGQTNGSAPGYFHFGPELICYGMSCAGSREDVTDSLPDVMAQVRLEGPTCVLPFDPTDVADNFRYERYVNGAHKPAWKKLTRTVYYSLRPTLPVSLRRHLQRAWLGRWDEMPFPHWPVDRTVDQMFGTLMGLALRASGQD